MIGSTKQCGRTGKASPKRPAKIIFMDYFRAKSSGASARRLYLGLYLGLCLNFCEFAEEGIKY